MQNNNEAPMGQAAAAPGNLVMLVAPAYMCERPDALSSLEPRRFFNGAYPVGVDNYIYHCKLVLNRWTGDVVAILRQDAGLLTVLRERAAELSLGDVTETGKSRPVTVAATTTGNHCTVSIVSQPCSDCGPFALAYLTSTSPVEAYDTHRGNKGSHDHAYACHTHSLTHNLLLPFPSTDINAKVGPWLTKTATEPGGAAVIAHMATLPAPVATQLKKALALYGGANLKVGASTDPLLRLNHAILDVDDGVPRTLSYTHILE